MSYLFLKQDGVVQYNVTLQDLITLFMESNSRYRSLPVAIIDIDNTLRCNSHRAKLLPSHKEIKDSLPNINDAYVEFNAKSHEDTAIDPVIAMVEALDQSYFILLLTSCTGTEENYKVLMNQCEEWGIPFDALIMRGNNCHLSSVDMKHEVVTSLRLDNNMGTIAIDDDELLCAMFHGLGITALNVIKDF